MFRYILPQAPFRQKDVQKIMNDLIISRKSRKIKKNVIYSLPQAPFRKQKVEQIMNIRYFLENHEKTVGGESSKYRCVVKFGFQKKSLRKEREFMDRKNTKIISKSMFYCYNNNNNHNNKL